MRPTDGELITFVKEGDRPKTSKEIYDHFGALTVKERTPIHRSLSSLVRYRFLKREAVCTSALGFGRIMYVYDVI